MAALLSCAQLQCSYSSTSHESKSLRCKAAQEPEVDVMRVFGAYARLKSLSVIAAPTQESTSAYRWNRRWAPSFPGRFLQSVCGQSAARAHQTQQNVFTMRRN